MQQHADYKDLLIQLHSPVSTMGTTLVTDGRAEGEETETSSTTFKTWPSEEALKAEVSITKDCKAPDRGLRLLHDAAGGYYLLSPGEDYTVLPGSHLGSVGSGSLLATDLDREAVIPWALPQGDKTHVQLLRAQEEEGSAVKEKVTFGTLYSVVRELEGSATTDITMTSFGRLIPKGDAGRHSYGFEFQPGDEKFEGLEFVPAPAGKSKATAANFFASTMGRTKGIAAHGGLEVIWRLTYSSVGHMLKPQKPSVVAKERIVLPAGQPVLVAWQ